MHGPLTLLILHLILLACHHKNHVPDVCVVLLLWYELDKSNSEPNSFFLQASY